MISVSEMRNPARMKPQPKSPPPRPTAESSQPSADVPHSCVLLFDMTLRPIAADGGAATILNDGPSWHDGIAIPDEVLESIRNRRASAGAPAQKFSIGRIRYSCKSYEVRSENPALPPTMIAVHIQADKNNENPIAKLALKHHLTGREAEALAGIAMGLSTKELAERMKISPNTAKAFVRLIMIKLGVTTRTAVVAKLLDEGGS